MYTEIKSFEDACKALNVSTDLPDFSMLSTEEQKAMTAHYKLTVIAKALNEGWKPKWENSDQTKYYPWFNMDQSDGGFSYNGYDDHCSGSSVGSRLCYHSREVAKYAGTQFEDLYKDYMIF